MNKLKLLLLSAIFVATWIAAYLLGRGLSASEGIPDDVAIASPPRRIPHEPIVPRKEPAESPMRKQARQEAEVASMSRDEIERLLREALEKTTTFSDLRWMELLWRRLGEIDGPYAARLAMNWPVIGMRSTVMLFSIAGWGDYEAGWRWIQDNIADPIQREHVIESLLGGMIAAGETDMALAKIADLPPGPERTAYIQRHSRGLARLEPEKIPDLMDMVPAGSERERIFQNFISSWADEDPRAAVDYTLTIENANSRRQIMNAVIRTWLTADGYEDAMTWLRSLSDSEADDARGSIARNRVRTDPDGAWALALEVQDESGRNSLLGGLTFSIAASHGIEEALQRVEQIPFGSGRRAAINSLTQAMLRQDRSAAEYFVRTSPLITEEHRIQLLRSQLFSSPPSR